MSLVHFCQSATVELDGAAWGCILILARGMSKHQLPTNGAVGGGHNRSAGLEYEAKGSAPLNTLPQLIYKHT